MRCENFLHGRGVEIFLLLLLADDLPGTDIGREHFWTRPHHMNPQRRAPRIAEYDDLRLAEMRAEIFGDFDTVARHLRDGHRALAVLAVLLERLAGAALIPLHDREILFPGPEYGAQRNQRVARTAGQHEKHRIATIVAANGDVLLDAVDADEGALVYAVRRGDGERLGVLMLSPGAVAEGTGHENDRKNGEHEYAAQNVLRHR